MAAWCACHGGFPYDRLFKPLLLKTIYSDKDLQEQCVKERRYRGETVSLR